MENLVCKYVGNPVVAHITEVDSDIFGHFYSVDFFNRDGRFLHMPRHSYADLSAAHDYLTKFWGFSPDSMEVL